jgi:hypothetical protein
MKKQFCRFISGMAVTILALAPLTARAEAYCTAIVTQAYTDASGHVTIYAPWRNDWTTLCNLNSPWKGVEPATCFGWFSVVNTAIVNGKSIKLFYADAQTNCATMPTYGYAPAPGYVMLT